MHQLLIDVVIVITLETLFYLGSNKERMVN